MSKTCAVVSYSILHRWKHTNNIIRHEDTVQAFRFIYFNANKVNVRENKLRDT